MMKEKGVGVRTPLAFPNIIILTYQTFYDIVQKMSRANGRTEIDIGEKELIWRAGFFDGEGNIHLRHSSPTRINIKGQYELVVNIVQTNKEILNSFLIFGGHIYKNYKVKESHSDSYTWRITGIKSKQFLLALLPYLRIKRDVVIVALDFIKTLLPGGSGKNRVLSPELIKKREELIFQFRKLQPPSLSGRKRRSHKQA